VLASLKLFLKGMFGGAIANLLVGAGLGVVSFAGISAALYTALAVVQSYVGGLTSDIFGMVMLLGLGESLSIIGSALLVRAAIASASVGVGKVSASGGG
jgi:hypothetical protein